ncbi:hypothetical protein BD779DRAFT_1474089 [Infundibulicybe gibba]|nr:hypothetical protein BD779DRAFT_1474089 [Infundibulicybe gibba]
MSDITLQVLGALQALILGPSPAPTTSSRPSTPNQSDHHDAPTPPNTPSRIRVNRPAAYSAQQDSDTAWYAVTGGRAIGVVMGWKIAEKMTNTKKWKCRRCDTEEEAWKIFFQAQDKDQLNIYRKYTGANCLQNRTLMFLTNFMVPPENEDRILNRVLAVAREICLVYFVDKFHWRVTDIFREIFLQILSCVTPLSERVWFFEWRWRRLGSAECLRGEENSGTAPDVSMTPVGDQAFSRSVVQFSAAHGIVAIASQAIAILKNLKDIHVQYGSRAKGWFPRRHRCRMPASHLIKPNLTAIINSGKRSRFLLFLAPYAWKAIEDDKVDEFYSLALVLWLDRFPPCSSPQEPNYLGWLAARRKTSNAPYQDPEYVALIKERERKKLVRDLEFVRWRYRWNKRIKKYNIVDGWEGVLSLEADRERRSHEFPLNAHATCSCLDEEPQEGGGITWGTKRSSC